MLFVAVSFLFLANTINIGADLGAMASAAQLVIGLPFVLWLFGFTVVTLVLEIFVSYSNYAKYLKYLSLSLIAYVIGAFVVKQNWGQVAWSTFIPTFSWSKVYILNVVAILGTTISPYLFFWQTGQEVEEEVEEKKIVGIGEGKPTVSRDDVRKKRADTFFGMFFSNLVMFFIIVTTAATLGVHNLTDISTAAQAAEALRPLAGDFTFILFTLGIVGTGMLAVPILAGSASYAIAEAVGWKEGFSRKLKDAHGFYGVIIIATFVGLLVNFLGFHRLRCFTTRRS